MGWDWRLLVWALVLVKLQAETEETQEVRREAEVEAVGEEVLVEPREHRGNKTFITTMKMASGRNRTILWIMKVLFCRWVESEDVVYEKKLLLPNFFAEELQEKWPLNVGFSARDLWIRYTIHKQFSLKKIK